MIIIDRGRKVAEGRVQELLDPARTLVEIKWLHPAESLQKIKRSTWNDCLQQVLPDGVVLQLHRDQVPQLNRNLVEMNIAVTGLQPRNSLEAYFLSLTGNNQHVAAFAH
jgi:ABC-2 type transport system ATP-binding protein